MKKELEMGFSLEEIERDRHRFKVARFYTRIRADDKMINNRAEEEIENP